MINLLQRVQDISKISNVLFSIIIIAVVTYLHVMTTPSIEIDTFLSIDKVVHMIIFYVKVSRVLFLGGLQYLLSFLER